VKKKAGSRRFNEHAEKKRNKKPIMRPIMPGWERGRRGGARMSRRRAKKEGTATFERFGYEIEGHKKRRGERGKALLLMGKDLSHAEERL